MPILSSSKVSEQQPRECAHLALPPCFGRADALKRFHSLVYSCGSLYTSIIPCLALRSVGLAIARSRSLRARVLLLNSKLDRETPGYTASDFVEAVRSACSGSYGAEGTAMPFEARELISHVVYIEGSEVQADSQRLHELGIVSVGVHSPSGMYDEQLVSAALRDIYASLE